MGLKETGQSEPLFPFVPARWLMVEAAPGPLGQSGFSAGCSWWDAESRRRSERETGQGGTQKERIFPWNFHIDRLHWNLSFVLIIKNLQVTCLLVPTPTASVWPLSTANYSSIQTGPGGGLQPLLTTSKTCNQMHSGSTWCPSRSF